MSIPLVISIDDVLIVALIFIVIVLVLAFTLPNIKEGGGNVTTGAQALTS